MFYIVQLVCNEPDSCKSFISISSLYLGLGSSTRFGSQKHLPPSFPHSTFISILGFWPRRSLLLPSTSLALTCDRVVVSLQPRPIFGQKSKFGRNQTEKAMNILHPSLPLLSDPLSKIIWCACAVSGLGNVSFASLPYWMLEGEELRPVSLHVVLSAKWIFSASRWSSWGTLQWAFSQWVVLEETPWWSPTIAGNCWLNTFSNLAAHVKRMHTKIRRHLRRHVDS